MYSYKLVRENTSETKQEMKQEFKLKKNNIIFNSKLLNIKFIDFFYMLLNFLISI